MTIQVNLDGRKRKELAKVTGAILGASVSYKGPPTYAYEVGKAIIGRDGNISLRGKRFNAAVTSRLLEELRDHGFESFFIEETEQKSGDSSNKAVTPQGQNPVREPETKESTSETPDKLVIQMPLEGFDETSLQNLRLLVDSKAALIKKSMGVADLPIEVTDTTMDFPWFELDLPQQELAAYTNFIAAMCDMAKRQKRVIAVERPTENEKFTMRLFTVRLGLIGDEYADTRRILY